MRFLPCFFEIIIIIKPHSSCSVGQRYEDYNFCFEPYATPRTNTKTR